MAVTNFIQTIWSKKILDDLQLKLKLVKNCHRAYQGDVKYARTVKILGVGEPTISDYNGTTALTYEAMSDKGQELVINQQKSFSFLVDDINEAQSVPGLAEEYRKKAVHGLATAADSYVASLIKGVTAAANVTTATAATGDAIKTAIDTAIVAMRERNFDEEGVVEVTPAVYNALKNVITDLSTNNPEYITTGKIGNYDGFDVIMSNNMAKDTTGSGTKYAYCCVRGKKAIAFADQINEVEAFRHQDFFADAVRGLYTYGGKVIDEKRIQVVKVPLAA